MRLSKHLSPLPPPTARCAWWLNSGDLCHCRYCDSITGWKGEKMTRASNDFAPTRQHCRSSREVSIPSSDDERINVKHSLSMQAKHADTTHKWWWHVVSHRRCAFFSRAAPGTRRLLELIKIHMKYSSHFALLRLVIYGSNRRGTETRRWSEIWASERGQTSHGWVEIKL
jgi:hypothetical protein